MAKNQFKIKTDSYSGDGEPMEIAIDNKHRSLVQRFILSDHTNTNACNLWHTDQSKKNEKLVETTREIFYGLADEMKDAGIFTSKYDVRSVWRFARNRFADSIS